MSPTIIAALILTAKLMICKENPAKIPVWEATAGGTVNLQFSFVRIKE
jgi:hypothetical protein